MKKTIKNFTLLLIAFSITLISCKKKTNDDDDNNPETTDNATCRLKKASSGSGDITYTYNTDNEITSIHFSNGYAVEITYDASGKLASIYSNFGNQITTNNYQFNTSGQPVSATSTMVEPNGTTTVYPLTFTHTGDKLTEIRAEVTGGGYTLTTTDTYTYNGDNVSSLTTQVSLNGSPTSTETTTYLDYDSKKNPYAELGHLIKYSMFQSVSGSMQNSKNNCIKVRNNDGTIKITSLEYNNHNNPNKATENGKVATITYYQCE